jgi:hypothetical protein
MASFRKIGGRTRNMNNNSNKTKAETKVEPEPQSNEQQVEPRPTNHEMHIAQIESEQNQSVFYPLMSDNETPRYFEDAGLYYCFNQTVQDFVLNADHISATNIFNVDTLAFADGSTMSSSFQDKEKEETNQIYNQYMELNTEEETQQIVLPTCGVYLVTFCLNLGEHLTIQLNESSFTQTKSGVLTIHYDEQFANDSLGASLSDSLSKNKNQTGTPCLTFIKQSAEPSEIETESESHVTITRIA